MRSSRPDSLTHPLTHLRTPAGELELRGDDALELRASAGPFFDPPPPNEILTRAVVSSPRTGTQRVSILRELDFDRTDGALFVDPTSWTWTQREWLSIVEISQSGAVVEARTVSEEEINDGEEINDADHATDTPTTSVQFRWWRACR